MKPARELTYRGASGFETVALCLFIIIITWSANPKPEAIGLTRSLFDG